MPLRHQTRKQLSNALQSLISPSSNIKSNILFATHIDLTTKSLIASYPSPSFPSSTIPSTFQLYPQDLLIIYNTSLSTNSNEQSETWSPICLPHFNPNQFLFMYTGKINQTRVTFIAKTQVSFYTCSEMKSAYQALIIPFKPMVPLRSYGHLLHCVVVNHYQGYQFTNPLLGHVEVNEHYGHLIELMNGKVKVLIRDTFCKVGVKYKRFMLLVTVELFLGELLVWELVDELFREILEKKRDLFIYP